MLGGNKEQIGAGDPNSATLMGRTTACLAGDWKASVPGKTGRLLAHHIGRVGHRRFNFLLDSNFHQAYRSDRLLATHTAHTTTAFQRLLGRTTTVFDLHSNSGLSPLPIANQLRVPAGCVHVPSWAEAVKWDRLAGAPLAGWVLDEAIVSGLQRGGISFSTKDRRPWSGRKEACCVLTALRRLELALFTTLEIEAEVQLPIALRVTPPVHWVCRNVELGADSNRTDCLPRDKHSIPSHYFM
ncbi:hypothetical protein B0H16DRAFT_1471865 [Mycena metata]|uniref:Uncharacterized protein n=1 Tax=Mycena metata TaxID=1033252 RepID=A0AAD7HPU0_9AGAR|nr:hypothetical protein B0H16DRAFT_1471865 [Mycena metata]